VRQLKAPQEVAVQERVLRIIQAEFSPESRERVIRILEIYGTAAYDSEIERVRIATLFLAKGDCSELERLVAAAKIDFRDVLAWAEYPRELHLDPRDESAQLSAARTADREQYHRWLKQY
jgi:hypothetical protein